KTKKEKKDVVFGGHEFFALIPGSSAPSATVSFVLEESNFDNLAERLGALIGAVNSFPKATEIDALRVFLEHHLRDGFDVYENGGPYQDFLSIVEYAQASQTAFPGQTRLKQLHQEVMERKAWTETTVSTLRALLNNRNWDDFLVR